MREDSVWGTVIGCCAVLLYPAYVMGVALMTHSLLIGFIAAAAPIVVAVAVLVGVNLYWVRRDLQETDDDDDAA